jgi:hypothetical protein
MTVGALIQLEYGNADRMAFLTLNPQITHFKSVYKKYTNFATQFITNQPIAANSTALSFDTETKITFQLPRDGDAVRDMYLTLELPDIYSDSNYQFQWIKRIGEYIVKSVSLQIDTNQNVDKHYSEWFHAYSELNYDEGKKKGYYEMIGNVPEMYDPANAPGNNGQYPSTTYAPSIINRKIYLPLIFWFNKFASMSFPLVSIQKTIIYINFTFRRLNELYTLIDYTGDGGTGYRIKPQNNSKYFIGNFLLPKTIQSDLYFNPRLEINNVFLDNEERKRFALSSHEYLITQLQAIYQTCSGSDSINLKDINKPVTELVFMIRRTDMEDVNDWSNYTNWNITDIPPYSNGYSNPYGSPLTINSNNIKYYKTKNLLKSAVLKLLTHEITSGDVVNNDTLAKIDGKDSIFYNKMQNFNANQNIPYEGIYTYSFSLDNSSLQPIGAVNMSNISNKEILLNLTNINPNGGYNYPLGTTYDYHVYVFAVNYEILKIMGGKVNTMTAN